MKKFLLLVFVSSILSVVGQKKTIDYTCFDEWKSLKDYSISDDGQHVLFVSKPQKGNSELFIYSDKTQDTLNQFIRGTKPNFIGNDYFMFVGKPDFEEVRQLKLEKTKKDKMPKDELVLFSIMKNDTIFNGTFKSYSISKTGNWIAWLSTEIEKEACCTGKKKCRCRKPKKIRLKKGEPEIVEKGNTLFYVNLSKDSTYQIKRIHHVKDFTLAKNGSMLAYTQLKTYDKKDSVYLSTIRLSSDEKNEIYGPEIDISKLNFSENGNYLSYMSSSDTSKIKVYDLGLHDVALNQSEIIVDSKELDTLISASFHKMPYFSLDEKRLFYGVGKRPINEPKDTLLTSEKAKLDLWSWSDKLLQPQQLKQAKKDINKSNLHVFHIQEKKHIQLENDSIRWAYGFDKNRSAFGGAVNVEPYKKSQSWSMPWPEDVYRVNINTGEKELIQTAVKHSNYFSPSGKYFVWYNATDSNFYSKNLEAKNEVNLTRGLDKIFTSDNNGMPYEAYPNGILGFEKEGEQIFMKSQFDIWKFHPEGTSAPINITKVGREDSTQFTFQRLRRDSAYLHFEDIMVSSHNYKTHDEFLYLFDGENLEKISGGAFKLYDVSKAKNSPKLITRWGNTVKYPELTISNEDHSKTNEITKTNAEQEDYNWTTVESVYWTTPKGEKLEGLLYKPEDFDSTKKYPLMVYFYEMYSKSKNAHYAPRPSASIINPVEYASNGYIVFIPDIRYEIGHPAQSAYNCIVSGTDALVRKYAWIDSTRMALQGQSWGGYQTAQLVTMTDKYKCAMAGAPVTNMFSAYGGIRWGSGMSRMFQYEHTQSRIGATIWEKPDLYKENSPVFGLPNVKTPILIMHNDGDGAVPWYQGIEMFVGLRRLNKPVWMLNYNGDEHNLMQRANRMDLTRRMRGFFDYYLLDKEMPSWMKNGIPAVDKGKKDGFEFISE
jgi:dipeptidyl aminopeptidase/acylaminoacyl peptidase